MAWVTKYRRRDGGTSYRVGWRDPSGKIHLKTFRRRAQADAHARRVEGDKQRGDYLDPKVGQITLRDYFDLFMDRATHLKPSSRELYRGTAKRHILPTLGGRPLATITPSDVRGLLAALSERAGASTVRTTYRVLRRVLSAAVDDGRIGRNPASRVKELPVETRREARYLTPTEVRGLIDELPPRYRAMVLLMAYGGLRIGEAAALRVGDVDFLRGRVYVRGNSVEVGGRLVEGSPKGGGIRTVVIPRFIVEALSRHVAEFGEQDSEARLFTTELGNPIRQSRFRRTIFAPAAERAGLNPLRVHDLRHTAVAMAIAAGYHPKAVQELAGHASITMTLDRYGHLFDTLQDAGVERLNQMAQEGASLP